MQEKNTLSVEWRAIGSIRPYPGNPRRITQAAIEGVARSITKYGWRQPIVVDEAGEIIVGHTRYAAAQLMKLKKVPVHVAAGMSPEEVRAYRLADNRTGEESEWDLPALAIEFKGLQDAGFDLTLTAFTDADFARAFADPLALGPIDASAEWNGMPEYQAEDKRSFRKITVHFADQEAVDDFAKRLEQVITPKAPFIWHPELKKRVRTDQVYTADAEPGE